MVNCGTAPSAPALPQFTTTTTTTPEGTERTIPRACAQVITDVDLDELLETRLGSGTAEVAGQPMPAIGRTARLDCYFGVPGGKREKAALVVTLAAYTDDAAAQERLDRTVADERAQGARVSEVAVGPDTGYLIEGSTRIVVARHGKVTVVVQAAQALVPGESARRVLPRVADRALTHPSG
ncbi:hypothetical protein GCM10023148_57850 [Actinokineospora soli]